ncbi:MAG: NADP-dependent oxidoreductase [Coprobacter sp.]|nr:NADP-dependent oxidoreductase [Coprobacter sp.]
MNTRQFRLYPSDTTPLSQKDFQLENAPVPPLQDKEVLVRNLCIAIDLYRIDTTLVGSLPAGAAVAVVVESRDAGFAPGDRVVGLLTWSVYTKVPAGRLRKICIEDFPVEYYLSVLGLPGLTAYFALMDVCQLRKGQTLFVTDLTGDVGSVAGQIAAWQGCRVRGLVNTAGKQQLLKDEWGFPAVDCTAIGEEEISRRIAALCPDGIDACVENTSGRHAGAVLSSFNEYGRVALCGHMSTHPEADPSAGEQRWRPDVVRRHGTVKTIRLSACCSRFMEGLTALTKWVQSGAVRPLDTLFHGFDKLPEAFETAAAGKNTGKTLVRIGELRE